MLQWTLMHKYLFEFLFSFSFFEVHGKGFIFILILKHKTQTWKHRTRTEPPSAHCQSRHKDILGFLRGSVVKNLHLMQETRVWSLGSVPGSGRSAGGGRCSPAQYSCLENPTDRGPGGLQSGGSQSTRSQACTRIYTTKKIFLSLLNSMNSYLQLFWLHHFIVSSVMKKVLMCLHLFQYLFSAFLL